MYLIYTSDIYFYWKPLLKVFKCLNTASYLKIIFAVSIK